MNYEEKHFRENRPYGLVYDIKNNKAEFYNRLYQPLGETNRIVSIYDLQLRNVDLSKLSEDKIRSIFQTINPDKDVTMGFFYSDATNPYNQTQSCDKTRYLRIYENRLMELSKLIGLYP